MARDAEADAAMPITVFVVDDDEAVRDSLKLLLESYGMTVEDYGSTEEFVRHYRPRGRQCLILDQHLPGTTGLDFLASPRGAALGLPVVLVTGRGDRALRARAAELGVSVYLEKPVVDNALMAAIHAAVDGGTG
ncbi:MAG TPA: response regulator [Stellaceae bacterium]|nr:response regulator [Stellaceae bacterium]